METIKCSKCGNLLDFTQGYFFCRCCGTIFDHNYLQENISDFICPVNQEPLPEGETSVGITYQEGDFYLHLTYVKDKMAITLDPTMKDFNEIAEVEINGVKFTKKSTIFKKKTVKEKKGER